MSRASKAFLDRTPTGEGYYGSDGPERLSLDQAVELNSSSYGTGDGVPLDLNTYDPGALAPEGVEFNSALQSGYAGQLRYSNKRGKP